MMATLYDVDVRTINEHIKKIYSDSELEEDSTIRNFRIVQTEGLHQAVSYTHLVCGKQENKNRLTLAERIVIECGIYQKLKLSQIAKKIGKTPGSVSREIRLNRTVALGEHPCGKDCCFAGECKIKSLCGIKECSKRCVACCLLYTSRCV